jgi:hypothetical protein
MRLATWNLYRDSDEGKSCGVSRGWNVVYPEAFDTQAESAEAGNI